MSARERDEHAIWQARWCDKPVRVPGGRHGRCSGFRLEDVIKYQVTFDDGRREVFDRRRLRLVREGQ